MDGGSLNVRNDELFDKLDSAPRKDVNKLIQLQKETSSNSIKKQIKDSVTAIEETLFTLDIINTDLEDKSNSKTSENTDNNNKKTVFNLLVNNLNNSNSDNFIKKIEKLYNIFYKCYESEVTIKKLSRSSIDEYVKNRILGRVMYNIHYLKNYTRYYEQERFADIIKKLKKIPKIHEVLHSIEKKLKDILTGDITEDILLSTCIDTYNIIKPEATEDSGAGTGSSEPEVTIMGTLLSSTIIPGSSEQISSSLLPPPGGGPPPPPPPPAIIGNLPSSTIITASSEQISLSPPPPPGGGPLPPPPPPAIMGTLPSSTIITGSSEPEVTIMGTLPSSTITPAPSSSLFQRGGVVDAESEQDENKELYKEAEKIIEEIKPKIESEQDENTELYKEAKEIAEKLPNIASEIKGYVILTIFIKLKTAKKEYKADNTDNEYAKRAGKNTLEILQNSKNIKDQVARILLIDYYMVRNFEDTVDYFALETYYRIIFGTELSYDLKLFEENKYILTRLENIDDIYETIQTIAYDDTFRTLERLYFNKKIGHQNIFRIDTDTSLDIKVFEPQDVFKELHITYKTEPEKILRELIIFDINNGIVDRKNFELFLNFIYDDKHIELYNCLSNIFNMIITLTEQQDLSTINEKLHRIKDIIGGQAADAAAEAKTGAADAAAEAKTGAADTAPVEAEAKTRAKTGAADNLLLKNEIEQLVKKILEIINSKSSQKKKEDIKKIKDKIVQSIIKIKQFVEEYLSKINKSKQEEVGQTRDAITGLASNSGQGADVVGKENKSGLLNEIKQILNLKIDDDPKNNNGIKDIFDKYVNNNKIIGGSKIDIKREELEKNLNNTSLNDDLTESVTDNAKRKYKKLQRNIEKIFNAKENIEQDDNKLLDQEYLDILRDFNIDDIKTASYKDLREKLYKIKNNEYFEDIKITNEDIYTFIATTYVLRVISLYITMWFIQIEIVKDVHSVIVAYIITYILLFILIYTFVNLSDNQLDTSKSFLYYFYTRVNFSYTRFIVHLGLLLLLIIIPFVIRTIDKESSSYKHISDIEKRYLYTFITNMSIIVWVILSIIAFFFK